MGLEALRTPRTPRLDAAPRQCLGPHAVCPNRESCRKQPRDVLRTMATRRRYLTFTCQLGGAALNTGRAMSAYSMLTSATIGHLRRNDAHITRHAIATDGVHCHATGRADTVCYDMRLGECARMWHVPLQLGSMGSIPGLPCRACTCLLLCLRSAWADFAPESAVPQKQRPEDIWLQSRHRF